MKGFSLIATFTKLAGVGAEWVMWLLIALACVCIIVAVERLYLFLATGINVTSTARKLLQFLDRGELDKAQALVSRARAMEERVLADALSLYHGGPEAVEEIAHASMIREKQRYERAMSVLGTIGSNAPFVGLLGTVIGVILAFAELGRNPKGGLEVVGPGISEALVSTAVGLLVAIPAVVLFNVFKNMLKKRIGDTDFLCRLVVAQLKRSDRFRPEREAALAAEE
jgi:biopolymer transport protein ExbB